jgi:putative FmdB family regulatory protein
MPIFEFRCLQCGNLMEIIVKTAREQVDLECPDCRSQDLERVMSRASYIMGSGPGGKQTKITAKSCSGGNSCLTLDVPGPTK